MLSWAMGSPDPLLTILYSKQKVTGEPGNPSDTKSPSRAGFSLHVIRGLRATIKLSPRWLQSVRGTRPMAHPRSPLPIRRMSCLRTRENGQIGGVDRMSHGEFSPFSSSRVVPGFRSSRGSGVHKDLLIGLHQRFPAGELFAVIRGARQLTGVTWHRSCSSQTPEAFKPDDWHYRMWPSPGDP